MTKRPVAVRFCKGRSNWQLFYGSSKLSGKNQKGHTRVLSLCKPIKCTAQGANPDVKRYHAGLSFTTNVLLWGTVYSGMAGWRPKATVNLKLLSQDLLQHTCADLRNCRSWKAQPWLHRWELPLRGNEEGHCPPVISESHQWSCAQEPQANGKGTKEQRESDEHQLSGNNFPQDTHFSSFMA